jgi:hypothetical protein
VNLSEQVSALFGFGDVEAGGGCVGSGVRGGLAGSVGSGLGVSLDWSSGFGLTGFGLIWY